jgi:hypothetical protein
MTCLRAASEVVDAGMRRHDGTGRSRAAKRFGYLASGANRIVIARRPLEPLLHAPVGRGLPAPAAGVRAHILAVDDCGAV